MEWAQRIPFRASDSGPKRAGQLDGLCTRLCAAEHDIDALEQEVSSISPSGTPGDPGDMTGWFENALI